MCLVTVPYLECVTNVHLVHLTNLHLTNVPMCYFAVSDVRALVVVCLCRHCQQWTQRACELVKGQKTWPWWVWWSVCMLWPRYRKRPGCQRSADTLSTQRSFWGSASFIVDCFYTNIQIYFIWYSRIYTCLTCRQLGLPQDQNWKLMKKQTNWRAQEIENITREFMKSVCWWGTSTVWQEVFTEHTLCPRKQ